MSKLGVLMVHGMGNVGPDFADDMIDELRNRLRNLCQDPSEIRFKTVYWGSVLDGRENELYRRLAQDNDLDWGKIRRDIVISGFGDAIAYAGPSTSPSHVYPVIHEIIAKNLLELGREFEDSDHTPLVVMAHSLGCAIMSNYIWDAQNDQHGKYTQSAITPFARAETLSGFITFGCNLPLFTLALPQQKVEPIKFPGPRARQCFANPDAADSVMEWANFFDPDDILGYPLKAINGAYEDTVSKDIAINTGTILGAHNDYWTDNDFTKPAARLLARMLEKLQ